MLGVLAQRLVRTLCPQCKQPDDATRARALDDIVKPWKITGSGSPTSRWVASTAA
jgi:general secretion pathway protein E